MSVIFETSLGVVTIDLHCDEVPVATKNFLKLCKVRVAFPLPALPLLS